MIYEDEMTMPCECPKCGAIHELAAARKCRRCGELCCPRCLDAGVCFNCLDDEENDTL